LGSEIVAAETAKLAAAVSGFLLLPPCRRPSCLTEPQFALQ
jgi:hypothetical protein